MKKKLLSLVLALAMCLGLCGSAFATWETNVAPGEAGSEYPTDMDFIKIGAGETAGKSEKYGNSCTLSQPVLSVEMKTDWSGQKHPLHLIPIGTIITFVNADGTTDQWISNSDDGDGGGANENPSEVWSDSEMWMHWGDEMTYGETILYFKGVKTSEAGDTTPAPDPNPDPKPEEPQPAANPFTDVKESDYYYAPVLWAVEKGITNGTTDTTFSPNSTCTVTEILTFLWRAAGSPEPAIESPYQNVSMDSWFGPAVIWAYEKGMSVSEDLLTADCTRALTATFLWQAAGSPEVDLTSQFTDVDMSSFYALAVAWAVENGVTTGTSGTTFSPNDTCTRGQIAAFLYRAFAK